MLKMLDIGLSLLAIAIGVLHSFIVAPQIYKSLTLDAFWFFAAGLAIIFTGVLNGLRIAYGSLAKGVYWSALFASLTMLGLIAVFAWSQKAVTDPVVLLQLVTYAGLVVMSLMRRV